MATAAPGSSSFRTVDSKYFRYLIIFGGSFMFSSLGAGLLILWPLSFLPAETMGDVWNILLLILWSAGMIGVVAYVSSGLDTRRKAFREGGSFVLMCAFSVMFGLVFLFSLLQLTPVAASFNLWLIFTLLFAANAIFIGDDLLRKYKSYLAQTHNFVRESMRLIVLLVFWRLMGIASVLPVLSGWRQRTFVAIELVSLVGIVWIVHSYVRQMRQNDQRAEINSMLWVMVAVGILETSRWILLGKLDHFVIGLFFFIVTLLYVAERPVRRKSRQLEYLGVLVFLTLFCSEAIGLEWIPGVVREVAETPLAIFLAVVGIGLALHARGTFSTYWSERGRGRATEAAVRKAVDEILEKEESSLSAIQDAMSVSVTARRFGPVQAAFEARSGDLHPELALYWRLYLEAAVHAVAGRLPAALQLQARTEPDMDEEAAVTAYLRERLPDRIYKAEIWRAFDANPFIRRYLGSEDRLAVRPRTVGYRVLEWAERLVAVVVILALLLTTSPELVQLAPKLLKVPVEKSVEAVSALRLRLAVGLRPFERSPEHADYYADAISRWADRVGDADPLERARWFDLVASLVPEEDERHPEALYYAAYWNQDAGEVDDARQRYQELVDRSPSTPWRNHGALGLSSLVLAEGTLEEAIAVLETIPEAERTGPLRRRLATLYLEQGAPLASLASLAPNGSSPDRGVEALVLEALALVDLDRGAEARRKVDSRRPANEVEKALLSVAEGYLALDQGSPRRAAEEFYWYFSRTLLLEIYPGLGPELHWRAFGAWHSTLEEMCGVRGHPHCPGWLAVHSYWRRNRPEVERYMGMKTHDSEMRTWLRDHLDSLD